jgi:glutaminase
MSGLEVNAVSAFLAPRRFLKGDIVFFPARARPARSSSIVRTGRIGSFATLPDGSRRDIYEFGPGLLFGEMAIIEDEPRSATCWAKEDPSS